MINNNTTEKARIQAGVILVFGTSDASRLLIDRRPADCCPCMLQEIAAYLPLYEVAMMIWRCRDAIQPYWDGRAIPVVGRQQAPLFRAGLVAATSRTINCNVHSCVCKPALGCIQRWVYV